MVRIVKSISTFLSLLTVIATSLPFIHRDEWWIRSFDFPRVQIIFIGNITLLLYILFIGNQGHLDRILILLVLLSIAYQCYSVHPYTRLVSKQVLDADKHKQSIHFSMVITNVLMSNRNVGQCLDIIRHADPDIILAMETDAWWEEHLRSLEEEYPYTVKCPLENTYGMLLYSRLELIRPEIKFLVEEDIPSIHSGVRISTDVFVELRCLHPRPPRPFQSSTERDVELLLVAKEVRHLRGPVVVAGDLNDVAWSYTTTLFQKVSGLLDPRIGRGFYNTFDAKNPLLRFPLDHVFHSNHFKLIELTRLPYFGSDHFPIYVHLSLEPGAQQEQKEPSANKEDLRQAEEELEKERE